MKELVLLTGASSGIGREMAALLAEKQIDLILVARRRDALEELKKELEAAHGIRAYVFPCDLSDVRNALTLYEDVRAAGLEVTMLVNNAGFGGYGEFADTPLDHELDMIQVNIASLVALTKLCLPDMKRRNHGRIMNLGSLLSFFPFPYYAVYAASKAFVLSFSEALRTELEGTGISVTALCPGPTDTPFNTDDMWRTNAYKQNKPMDVKTVARIGVDSLLAGRGTRIAGWRNALIANTPRFSPRWLTLKINKFLASGGDG